MEPRGAPYTDLRRSLLVAGEPQPSKPPAPTSTTWTTAFSAAVPIAMMNLAQAVTYGALVCKGTGLDVALVSAMHMLGILIVQAFFFVRSSVPQFAIASSDITVALLNHQIVSDIYDDSSGVPPERRFDTALAALGACTAVQGLLYLALGRLRAAEMVQYLPFSVVAGCFAVTGCYIIKGALTVTTGIDLSWSTADHSDVLVLLQARPQQVLSAALVGVVVAQISRVANPATAFVLAVPATLLLFYAIVGFNDMSLDELVSRGWLFTQRESRPLQALWTSRELDKVQWSCALPGLCTGGLSFWASSLVCMLFAMLKALAVEASCERTIDVNDELATSGVANLLSAACGGATANHASTYVSVLRNANVSNRRVAVVASLLTLGVLASGAPFVNFIPRLLLGGLLMAVGAQMVAEWTVGAWGRIDSTGRAVLCAMLFTGYVGGRTHAVFLGLVAAVGTTHARVSRLNALKYHVTARSYHPTSSRPLPVQHFLNEHGTATHLIGLEGYLYEGVAARLLRYVERLATKQPWLRFVILDLGAVQGVDPSACALLGKLRRALGTRRPPRHPVRLLLASLQPSLLPTLVAHAALSPHDARASLFSSADAALEWCEDDLLLHGSPLEGQSPAEQMSASRNASPSNPPSAPPYLPPEQPLSPLSSLSPLGGGAGGAGGAVAATATAVRAGVGVGVGGMQPSGMSGDSDGDRAATAAAPPLLRAYAFDAEAGGATLPFAPLPLGASAGTPSWASLAQHGSLHSPRPGEVLVAQGERSRDVWVAPSSGVVLHVTIEVGGAPASATGADGYGYGGSSSGQSRATSMVGGMPGVVQLATMRHGGVFGAEGALLGLPSVCSVACISVASSAPLLRLSSAQLQLLRDSPQSSPLLAQLHAAAHAQQQDYLFLLAKRTTLWLGGGWSGPAFDVCAAPPAPDADNPGTIPSSLTLPEGFGRKQLWRRLEREVAPVAPAGLSPELRARSTSSTPNRRPRIPSAAR